MQLERLNLYKLEDIDHANAEVDVALKRIAEDILMRPHIKSKRSVVIKIDLKPITANDGSTRRATCAITVDSRVPKHRTRTVHTSVTSEGVNFNHLSLGDVDQATIPV